MKKFNVLTLILVIILSIPALGQHQVERLTMNERKIASNFLDTLALKLEATVIETKFDTITGTEFILSVMKCNIVPEETFKLYLDQLSVEYNDIVRLEPYRQTERDGIEAQIAIKMDKNRLIVFYIRYFTGEKESLVFLTAGPLTI